MQRPLAADEAGAILAAAPGHLAGQVRIQVPEFCQRRAEASCPGASLGHSTSGKETHLPHPPECPSNFLPWAISRTDTIGAKELPVVSPLAQILYLASHRKGRVVMGLHFLSTYCALQPSANIISFYTRQQPCRVDIIPFS